MKLVTVKYTPVSVDARSEARHDAERCVVALQKHFPQTAFSVKEGSTSGEFEVHATGSMMGSLCALITGFAEGFIASTFLWER